MANTAEWEKPGDYLMSELSLVFHNNTKIGIIPNAVEINIYESIYASAMTGIIIFRDDESILETYTVVGSEQIILQLTTSLNNGFHTINKVFDIVKISDFISEGSEQYYTLHLATPIMMLDKNYKLSMPFDDKAENIINSVYQNTLGFDDVLIADATKYPRKFVAPQMHPLKLFNYLADTSIDGNSDNDTDAGFVFYESSVGMNFRYLRGLYDNGVPFVLKENGKNLPVNTDAHLDVVLDAYLPVMFNNVDNTMLGVFGNTVQTHDILNKTITTNIHEYSGSLVPNPDEYSHNNRYSFMSGNYDGKTSGKWGQTAAANKQLFDNFNIVLTIYGNSNITVGQTITYEQATNVFGEIMKEHRVFPKKHLITNIKHSISGDVYTQSLEASSDRWYE